MRRTSLAALLAVTALAALVAGPSVAHPTVQLQTVGAAFAATYVPAVYTAARGETFVFRNNDILAPHTFTTGLAVPSLLAGNICAGPNGTKVACNVTANPNSSVNVSISPTATPGTYGFHCNIHANMNGIIQIT